MTGWPGQKGQGPQGMSPEQRLSQRLFQSQYKMTSGYGPRDRPVLGGGRFGSANHWALDYGAPQGTKIYNPFNVPALVRKHPRGGFTMTDPNTGRQFRVLHAEALSTVIDRMVKAGMPVGRIGPKDNLSTGAHGHFEFYVNGKRTNPLEAFKAIAEGKETKAVVRDNRDGRIKMERRIDGPMVQQQQMPRQEQGNPFLNALLQELYKEVLG